MFLNRYIRRHNYQSNNELATRFAQKRGHWSSGRTMRLYNVSITMFFEKRAITVWRDLST